MSARNFDINKARKYGNVTVIHNEDSPKGEVVHVRLHKTIVFRYDRETGRVTLNSGGWHTLTTKTAINTALKQVRQDLDYRRVSVFQRKGDWFVSFGTGAEVPFKDGMMLEIRPCYPIRVLANRD